MCFNYLNISKESNSNTGVTDKKVFDNHVYAFSYIKCQTYSALHVYNLSVYEPMTCYNIKINLESTSSLEFFMNFKGVIYHFPFPCLFP